MHNLYYFRMEGEKYNFIETGGITARGVAAEAARLILEAIGRACHMSVEKEATLESY